MRLWHQSLLPYLSRQRLLSQHRECCALRGKGWGRKHKTVDYVFNHHPAYLVMYHRVVMDEMQKRGYKVDHNWDYARYCGKNLPEDDSRTHPDMETFGYLANQYYHHGIIYPEHDDTYLDECLEILEKKGEHINYPRPSHSLFGTNVDVTKA